jgi:transposase
MDWPTNSSDVNPIENICSIVKYNVEKRKSKNINELEQFLSEEFKNIVKNCVMSIENICLSLIYSKDERIKY